MHEDPTRRMDVPPPPGEPPRQGLSRGVKVAIGVLVAAVLGLGVALAVVASDDDEPATSTVTSQPTTTTPTTTEPTTTTTPTEPTTTTTEPTTDTTTTKDTTTTETDGSGGTEAP
jgi:cytoskeletal protein RodZ